MIVSKLLCLAIVYSIALYQHLATALDFTLAQTGESFPNNGAIDVSRIGEGYPENGTVTGGGALICHVDNEDCCRQDDDLKDVLISNWRISTHYDYVPPAQNLSSGVYVTRGEKVLRLNRRNSRRVFTGVYACEIYSPTTNEYTVKLIGVYAAATIALCPNLVLENGEVTYDNAEIPGKVGNHTCNNGYRLIGQAERICSSNGWQGDPLTCVPVECGPLSIDNGQVKTSGTTFNNTAVYSCDFPYKLNGTLTSVCSSDRIWTPAAPTCDPPPPIFFTLGSAVLGKTLSNLSLSSVGEGPGESLICHTDQIDCCRQVELDESVGEWYYPNGSIVQRRNDNEEFYTRKTSSMALTLSRRNTTNGPGPAGVYCCVVPTSAGIQTFCVNLVVSESSPTMSSTTSSSLTTCTITVVGGVTVISFGLAFNFIIFIICIVIKSRKINSKRFTSEIQLKPTTTSLNDQDKATPTYHDPDNIEYATVPKGMSYDPVLAIKDPNSVSQETEYASVVDDDDDDKDYEEIQSHLVESDYSVCQAYSRSPSQRRLTDSERVEVTAGKRSYTSPRLTEGEKAGDTVTGRTSRAHTGSSSLMNMPNSERVSTGRKRQTPMRVTDNEMPVSKDTHMGRRSYPARDTNAPGNAGLLYQNFS